jgi:hypothetical protein
MGNQPALRFSLRDNRLFINGATIRQLGNKQYVQFLWDGKNRILFISGKFQKGRDTFELERKVGVNEDGSANEYVFQRRAFADAIILRMGWDKRESYKVVGAYAPRVKMVAFCLDGAVPLGRAGDNGTEGGAHDE